MLLPKGVTGFSDGNGFSAGVELRDVTALAHLAARLSGGRVGAVSGPGVTPNFYSAEIITVDQVVLVIVNQVHPLVAVAGRITVGAMVFRNGSDQLKQAVELTPPFRLLSTLELNRPLIGSDLADLADPERAQVRYWQPERVGDVIFNYWD